MHVLNGNCVEIMAAMDAQSFHAIVCDPPYGLEFMGKGWDKLSGQPGYVERGRITNRPKGLSKYQGAGGRVVNSYQAGVPMQEWHVRWLREAFRVLKPGGHLLAFGGSRTFHRLFCAAEDAGFEIRDTLMWLYGSGFPKSHNLAGKLEGWNGWGTALKPAHEPILLARKPLIGTVVKNVLTHGTGALNIDASRIGTDQVSTHSRGADRAFPKCPGETTARESGRKKRQDKIDATPRVGRWPANVIMDTAAGALLDQQAGNRGAAAPVRGTEPSAAVERDAVTGARRRVAGAFHADSGGPSRFFYCPKAKRSEKEAGCADLAKLHDRKRGNHHPTVKPVALMEYLIRLVLPDGGLLLDPFAGSGTTLVAAKRLGQLAVGIEENREYVEVAHARLAAVNTGQG